MMKHDGEQQGEERAAVNVDPEESSRSLNGEAVPIGVAHATESGDYPMREFHVPVPYTKGIKCNPVTSFLGIAVLWGLAIWCMVDPTGSSEALGEAKAGCTKVFTWFYIVTTPIMFFYMVYVYVVYGHQKLGSATDEVEFDAASYFAMIFSAGVAVGLFFYGVSEPLWHLSDNRFDTGYHSDAEYGVHAINLTLYHWGFGAWTGYVLVGVTAGIAAFREKLPLTMRSCFFPVIGRYTWGFWGDAIDAFSIVVVVSGVCTSLGLGAIQIVDGINILSDLNLAADSEAENTARIVCIWIVTGVATISVVSGLDVGIKILSVTAIMCGFVLWFLVLFLDDTKFLLNLAVEATGMYFQKNILEVAFATDAFGQLTRGNGRGIDGDQYQGLGAYAAWMNDWTIFYWAWWTAWASFVGLFIARISKGRTIREVIHFTLAGPLLYAFFWFSVFGGAGIRAYYRALEVIQLGTFQGDPDMYLIPGTTCYNPPTEPVSVTFTDKTGAEASWDYVNDYPGIGPVCTVIGNASWWNVLMQYYDYGPFLSWLAVIAIAIYFVTSSDSGSLVVDHLASNGADEEGFWIQRVFWAVTEGAVATALLSAGKSEALGALQAASIVAGLPFTVLLCTSMIGLHRFLVMHDNPTSYYSYNDFKMHFGGGVFNAFDLALSCGGHFKSQTRVHAIVPSAEVLWETLRALILPGWSTWIVMSRLYHKPSAKVTNIMLSALVQAFFIGWVALFASSVAQEGITAFAWLCFFMNAFILGALRGAVRARYNIMGNFGEDVGAGLVAYYQLLTQAVVQTEGLDSDDDSASSLPGSVSDDSGPGSLSKNM
ncbi:Hypothetical Protein FCC1311_037432 [Hondaea fermentalgiana]|uniref:Uncharacterized protein n=1 Tax=Hondaea fermentalgiana TaxID=2315210 RepID=A0A2R5G940_9STRA|nr:Hypothetical Protein FCC1311_037432 [Hondaea fermentalgiana]|eukprot:GBG27520.1 Hypothetical Protein FCC1311_037432 [Hondaea fermentalgiana]